MKTILSLAFTAVICIPALSGCYPTSVHPMTKNIFTEKHNDLAGIWEIILPEGKKGDDDKEAFLVVFKYKKDFVRLIVIDDKNYDDSYEGFVSVIGKSTYLNLFSIKEDDKGNKPEKEYLFVYYEIKNNNLTMTLLDNSYIKKCILAKKLKGTVKKEKYGDDVRITAEPGEIEKFIKATPASILLEKSKLLSAKKIR